MALLTPELLETKTYPFQAVRHMLEHVVPQEGVWGPGDFKVTQRAAGANMSVDVAAGSAWIKGDTGTRQGVYHLVNDAVVNLAVTAAHATLPRIDQVVARIFDSTVSGSSDVPVLSVLAGTATSGATLDNRTGAASLPNDAIRVADILVAAADTSITNAEIRDRRPFINTVVPPLTGLQAAVLEPVALPVEQITNGFDSAVHDTHQAAVLCQLRTPISGVTKIRWRYLVGGAAPTGTYCIGIYDQSGRKVAAADGVALTGGINTHQARAETITSTDFPAGLYYVLLGVDSTATGSIHFQGVHLAGTIGLAVPVPGMALRATSGGATAPQTTSGLTDISSGVTSGNVLSVPVVGLSTT